jgi:hypothetical protein
MDNGEGEDVVKCFASSGVVFPAVILIAFSLPTDAEDLGRLFFSADQRQNLNQKRSQVAVETTRVPSPKVKRDTIANQAATAVVPIPPQRITGRVTRSSGNNTVWVNQTPNYVRYSSRNPSKE